MLKNNKGITLIALVITIIILLIIAGISISTVVDTGIFEKAQEAKRKTEEAQANEEALLEEYKAELGKYGGGSNGGDQDEDGVSLNAADIASTEKKSEIYGKSVSYTPAGVATDVGWKVFYSDGTNIYLIADNYVERENIPESTKDGVATGHKVNNGNYSRSAYLEDILDDYTGSTNITNTRLKKLNNSFFSQGFTSTNDNMKAVAYMMDTMAWNVFKDNGGKADYVIGGSTVEMLLSSYSQKYGVDYQSSAVSDIGYQISNDSGTTWNDLISSMLNPEDNLYVIKGNPQGYGMWLASPSNYSSDCVIRAYYDGGVGFYNYSEYACGFRPVVCLNANVTLEEENGTYTIQ